MVAEANYGDRLVRFSIGKRRGIKRWLNAKIPGIKALNEKNLAGYWRFNNFIRDLSLQGADTTALTAVTIYIPVFFSQMYNYAFWALVNI